MNSEESSGPFNIQNQEMDEADLKELKRLFKELREARRISQTTIAERLKVSQATISAFEQNPYSTMRRKTLEGIRAQVQIWQGDASKIVQAHFSALPGSPGTAADGPGQSWDPTPTHCPACHSEIPLLSPPARFCSSCGESLAWHCKCGTVVEDEDKEANFCNQCGRPVIPHASEPNVYPLLEKEALERAKLWLRRSLSEWVEDQTAYVMAHLDRRELTEDNASERPHV
jgi:DNA-binding transcriptional regulator YiaG